MFRKLFRSSTDQLSVPDEHRAGRVKWSVCAALVGIAVLVPMTGWALASGAPDLVPSS